LWKQLKRRLSSLRCNVVCLATKARSCLGKRVVDATNDGQVEYLFNIF